MHVVTRTYSGQGAKELATLLSSRRNDVEKLIREVPGFVGYDLVQTADGCYSVTVCEDKKGADRSLEVARDWLKANAGHLNLAKPAVAEGKSLIHMHSGAAAMAH